MKETTKPQPTVSKYLLYGAIALLIVNFVMLFVPFLQVYQPSVKKTVLGVTTYEEWYTSSASMVTFILPAFLTGIPYVCAITSLSASRRKKNGKNSFMKIKNASLDKPIRFFWLKFASIANIIGIAMFLSMAQDEVSSYVKHGAYCRLTAFGFLNIVCTLAFIAVLFVLSHKTKAMVALTSKAEAASVNDAPQEQKTEENV